MLGDFAAKFECTSFRIEEGFVLGTELPLFPCGVSLEERKRPVGVEGVGGE